MSPLYRERFMKNVLIVLMFSFFAYHSNAQEVVLESKLCQAPFTIKMKTGKNGPEWDWDKLFDLTKSQIDKQLKLLDRDKSNTQAILDAFDTKEAKEYFQNINPETTDTKHSLAPHNISKVLKIDEASVGYYTLLFNDPKFLFGGEDFLKKSQIANASILCRSLMAAVADQLKVDSDPAITDGLATERGKTQSSGDPVIPKELEESTKK